MSNWQRVRLGDVCGYESRRIDICTLTQDTYISTENMQPNKGGITKSSSLPLGGGAVRFSKGQTLVSNIRPYFKKIWCANFDGGCSNDVLCFRNTHDVDSRYFYYLLSQDLFFDYVMSGSKGTKMPRGDKGQIMNFEFLLPSLVEQEQIAGILGALDDKIECNNRINRNLEEQAAVLFRRWFVDFEFPNSDGKPYRSSGGEMTDSPLGEIPTGWKMGRLGDYCRLKSGYAFKSSWWLDKGVKVIKIKNINSDNTLNIDDCSFVADDKINVAKDFKVIDGDLLIAMTGATIGKFAIVCSNNETLLVNQRVGKFFLGDSPNKKLPFIYNVLKQDEVSDVIINKGQGSAQPNISPNDIESVEFAYPDSNLIDLYNEKCFGIFKLIVDNQKENRTLATLRDTLLTKLMNNEIKTICQ